MTRNRRAWLGPGITAQGELLILLLWFVVAALLFPITQDEAYYYQWGLMLSGGYFDHPPGVALMSRASSFLAGPWLNGRGGTVTIAFMSALLLKKLYLRLLPESPTARNAAFLIGMGNAAALVSGFLTTPDALLLFFWILSLHEAAAALQTNSCRWISAGIATGLGLLSKYTMLLIGLVFLVPLLKEKRFQSLRTPYPWLGGIAALLIFIPNLSWNQENDWITWRFQLRHGFSMERPDPKGAVLPRAQRAGDDSPEQALAELFRAPADQKAQQNNIKGPIDGLFKGLKQLGHGGSILRRLLDFAGAQLALPGALLIPLGLCLRRRPGQWKACSSDSPSLWEGAGISNPGLKNLMQAAFIVPLAIFTLIAFRGKVEANWPAIWIIGAAPFIASTLKPKLNALRLAAGFNILLLAAVVAYALYPFIKVNPGLDRILKETKGYSLLSRYLNNETKQDFLFADSYQLVSMLRYHSPRLRISQWPGITRDSEFVYNPKQLYTRPDALKASGPFILVSTEDVPPILPGFIPIGLKKLNACREGFLVEQVDHKRPDSGVQCSPFHEWFVITYRPSSL